MLQPNCLVFSDVGGAEDQRPRGEVGVDVVVFVLKGADQHLLEEDLVQKTLLGRGGFVVCGVAVRGETKGSVEEGVLLHVIALEGLKSTLDLRQALF
ncbi:hypothetical protein [Corynebacterium flavescens]|uniref:hypothetical protein n=1 Tax=Corynebacterium flavescens TaxID=28028 RepID=UPI002011C2DF|nr:hypothetical protein [Corynebacterium flavescens]